MKKAFTFFSILALLLTSCRPTVNPNEWVITTATCWNTMTVSKAGDIFPKLYTTCDRAIVLPATEMSAEIQTETKFANRVAGNVSIAYQWRISDPLAFIRSAKSVVSSPTDDNHKIDPNALEVIENAVVDKILIDIIREYTPNKLAGTDELTIEKDLNKLVESQIAERGVEFSNMSVNVNFSPQTEEALDVISALKFYQQNGEEELGRKVIVEKAGATSITTQLQISLPKEE